MWTSALAFCQKRFEGQHAKYHDEQSGGIGCFTPDSFPVFDRFRDNVYVIADSNHGYKMIGVGELVADELLGEQSALLEPFRFSRYAEGRLHPVSTARSPGAEGAAARRRLRLRAGGARGLRRRRCGGPRGRRKGD